MLKSVSDGLIARTYADDNIVTALRGLLSMFDTPAPLKLPLAQARSKVIVNKLKTPTPIIVKQCCTIKELKTVPKESSAIRVQGGQALVVSLPLHVCNTQAEHENFRLRA